MHDDTLTEENRDKFIYIAGMYNQCVKFYNVEELCAEGIAEFKKRWPSTVDNNPATLGTMFRLLIPSIVPVNLNKIIYSDSDIIFNLDINELWKIELGDKPLAAIPEAAMGNAEHISRTVPLCSSGAIKIEDYFNAGILLMNLEMMRNEQKAIEDGMNFFSKYPPLLWDQDILNLAFKERYLKLPAKYNRFVHLYRNENIQHIEQKIYHYGGDHLRMDMQDNLNRCWIKYFAKTPWFNEETIGHLYEGIRQLYVEQKSFATQISALMSGKTRAFFVAPESIDAIRQIFYVKPEEEIIAADSPESLQRVANSLAARNKVFFVLANYPAVHAALTHAGFVEGRDFLNAAIFLSDAHGVPLNTYSFVKLL